jgi:hypothetical protein
MTSFVKLVAVFSVCLLAVEAFAEKSADEKPKKKSDSKESTGKKTKEETKKTQPAADEKPKVIDIPVPKDHDAKGLKIPYFDEEGKLQMRFNIGVAKRIDDTHIEMAELQVEMFDDQGQHEMSIDLPTSVLDLTTSVLTAQKQVTIKRDDFELTGNTMIFNTKTKVGGLGGKVRMLIYNLESETASEPATPDPKEK